jgi:hypothetical protein
MSLVQFASLRQADAYAEAAVANAPPHVRAAINRERATRGLAPLLTKSQRFDLEKQLAATAAAAYGAAAGRPARPAAVRAAPPVYIDRVLAVVGYGLARGSDIGRDFDELIDKRAFGTADELNAEIGWLVKDGHDPKPGSILAMRGDRLRAHDSEIGLVVEWEPDHRLPWHRDLFRRIENGATGCSPAFEHSERDRRYTRLPHLCTVVMRAKLMHLAIGLPRDGGAHRGCVAKAFRARKGNRDDLTRDIAAVVQAAQFAERNRR